MFFHAFNPDLQENKQRLNLSEHAYRTLINDASVFLPEDSPKTETGGIPSGILNQIFRSFAPSAESSISTALENHRLALEEVLSPMYSEKDQKIAIDLLLDAFKSQLLQRCQERLAQKGNAFSIRKVTVKQFSVCPQFVECRTTPLLSLTSFDLFLRLRIIRIIVLLPSMSEMASVW